MYNINVYIDFIDDFTDGYRIVKVLIAMCLEPISAVPEPWMEPLDSILADAGCFKPWKIVAQNHLWEKQWDNHL